MFTDGIKNVEMMRKIAIKPKLKARTLNEDEVKDIKRKIRNGMSDTQIANIFNCTRGKIYCIRKEKTYKEVVA